MTTPDLHPTPQFTRPRWASLDGAWEFAFDDADLGRGAGWHDGRALPLSIEVPFPYQSERSGIGTQDIHEIVWYARGFEVPEDWRDDDLLLHFGAVDYSTEVWINGRLAGRNRGGHVPFSFDVAPFLQPGSNRITLRVEDRQDPCQPRGKQSASGKPVRIYYWCTTGIWQGVWLEPVPALRIDTLRIVTAEPDGRLSVQVQLHAPSAGWTVELDVLDESGNRVAFAQAETPMATVTLEARIDAARPWSDRDPYLYGLRVRLVRDGAVLDEVASYCGLRRFEARDGRFWLNGEQTFLLMALDQGYWPDTNLAAPSPAALREDVEWLRRLGFNAARKHQKIEDPRWLYWCDRLGVLVWEEMPNARSWSLDAEEALLAEWERAVERDLNHPCIVGWVPLVESFGFGALHRHPGQHAFIEKLVQRTRRIDPTRPVIDNDGWEHTDLTDVCSIHDYTQPGEKLAARYAEANATGVPPLQGWYKDKPLFLPGGRYRGQPVVLSEVGGFLSVPEEAGAPRDRLFDYYGSVGSAEELLAKYRDLMEHLGTLTFLAGFCYTQFTDVEHEKNGLLTFDRQPKIDPAAVAALHRALLDRFGGCACDDS
ncbi:glycosyl hydrolase family 2 [Pseudoduganella lurida]|uniref:Glycosyl hydrolase family 2 n=1 Tax=Pseudoduganella lurida TaxID=1036180 RepID=A0A562R3K3_9BURK|nr:sugar-binding domain-containing protein [Pseudoduganella lurida]TWI63433.1 glycosyl hydrolase family 2 [Pseudoduganella lurida]